MKFSLKNDSMCYNDAYLMASRAVNLYKNNAEHGYKGRKWEYFAIPGYNSVDSAVADEPYYYAITRMTKENYSELVGILWL